MRLQTTLLRLCSVILAVFVGTSLAFAQTAPATQADQTSLQLAVACQSAFLCEKHIASLPTPFISEGTLYAQTPDSFRLSTMHPYTSDIILSRGKIVAKSQHETKWATKSQPARPGFVAALAHLGQLACGNVKPLLSTYTITPDPTFTPPTAATETVIFASAPPVYVSYLLVPRDTNLAQNVKAIHISVDPATNALYFYELITPQADVIRYWLIKPTHPTELEPTVFSPK